MADCFAERWTRSILFVRRRRLHRAGVDFGSDPWAVFTPTCSQRGVVARAARVLLTIVLTFIGAAADTGSTCTWSVSYFADQLPAKAPAPCSISSSNADGADRDLMIVWGARPRRGDLVQYDRGFSFLSVGVTYLPIPVGGFAPALHCRADFPRAPSDPLSRSSEVAPFDCRDRQSMVF